MSNPDEKQYLTGSLSRKIHDQATIAVSGASGTKKLAVKAPGRGPRACMPLRDAVWILPPADGRGAATPVVIKQKAMASHLAGLDNVVGLVSTPEGAEPKEWQSEDAPRFEPVDQPADMRAFRKFYFCGRIGENRGIVPAIEAAFTRERCRTELRQSGLFPRVRRAWWLSALADYRAQQNRDIPAATVNDLKMARQRKELKERALQTPLGMTYVYSNSGRSTPNSAGTLAALITAAASSESTPMTENSLWDTSVVASAMIGIQAGVSTAARTPGPWQAKIVAGGGAALGGMIAGWEVGNIVEGILDDALAGAQELGVTLSSETQRVIDQLAGHAV